MRLLLFPIAVKWPSCVLFCVNAPLTHTGHAVLCQIVNSSLHMFVDPVLQSIVWFCISRMIIWTPPAGSANEEKG